MQRKKISTHIKFPAQKTLRMKADENAIDLAAFDERKSETLLDFENVVKKIKKIDRKNVYRT